MISEGNADAKVLLETPVARPGDAGHAWSGVNHGHLVNGLNRELVGRGYRPGKATYYLSRDGADVAASIRVGAAVVELPPFFVPCIGLVASNARRKGLTFYCGATDTKSETPLVIGKFGGEDQRNRPHWKYTGDFDLVKVCKEAVDWWEDKITEFKSFHAALCHKVVTDREAKEILFLLSEWRLIPWSKVGQVLKMFAGMGHERTGWGFFKSFWCREVGQYAFPPAQMDRMLGLLAAVNYEPSNHTTVGA